MRYETTMFIGLIAIGLLTKKMDWRSYFFLTLFICFWVLFNWKKG